MILQGDLYNYISNDDYGVAVWGPRNSSTERHILSEWDHFNKGDLSKIEKLKYGFTKSSNYTNKRFFYLTCSYYRRSVINITIHKLVDEYFLVVIDNTAYKCDQIDGVIQLFNHYNLSLPHL